MVHYTKKLRNHKPNGETNRLGKEFLLEHDHFSAREVVTKQWSRPDHQLIGFDN